MTTSLGRHRSRRAGVRPFLVTQVWTERNPARYRRGARPDFFR
ncbi:hypothetical protein WMF20_29750 [Sorangium sp. So ce834]